MKKLLLLLLMAGSAWASNFTEFYVTPTGSHLNSGHTADNGATYTAVNGNWDGVNVYIPTDSSTPASTVTNGAWASVYVDGATETPYVARVTNVAAGVNGAISLSAVAFSGTPPTSSATARSIKVGGAWTGPNPGTNFPFNFVSGSMTNSSGNSPRVNITGSYWTTNGLTETGNNGTVIFEGYTNTIGDGGLANLYGSNGLAAAYNILFVNGAKNRVFKSLQFATNSVAGTGSATQYAVYVNANEDVFYRCVFHDSRLAGLGCATPAIVVECEAWNCNLANNASFGGFQFSSAGNVAIRCYSHHNTNANVAGFQTDGNQVLFKCISATNGADGFRGSGDIGFSMINCVAYGNGKNGWHAVSASGTIGDPMAVYFENNCFVGNGGCGYTNDAVTGYYSGVAINSGFGTGTQTNAFGEYATKLNGILVSGTLMLPADTTPWVAPLTGNFSISANAVVRSAGIGNYTETGLGMAGTVGYPDIGAAQAADTNSASGGTVGYGFAQ